MLLLGHEFIMFILEVQEMFKFCQVFEATNNDNFRIF